MVTMNGGGYVTGTGTKSQVFRLLSQVTSHHCDSYAVTVTPADSHRA